MFFFFKIYKGLLINFFRIVSDEWVYMSPLQKFEIIAVSAIFNLLISVILVIYLKRALIVGFQSLIIRRKIKPIQEQENISCRMLKYNETKRKNKYEWVYLPLKLLIIALIIASYIYAIKVTIY